MSSEGHPYGDEPTHHPPWPYIDPFTQGRLERKCIQDGETLNFDNLPKLQSWSSLFGGSYLEKTRVVLVLKRIENNCNTVQRPLTAAEANAIGEHTAHAIRYYSWIQPLSITIALGISYYKRRTFSFPFYRPKMRKFDPYSFPMKQYPLFKGQRAALLWHSMRFFAYLPFAWVPSVFFCASMCDQSFLAHSQRDPRLTSLMREAHQKIQQMVQQKVQERLSQRPGHPAPTPFQHPQQTGDSGYSDDSPRQSDENAGFSSKPAPERVTPAPELSRGTQPTWARTSSSERDDTDDLFDDDDASPVAASARRQEVPGSSWEYIRQQAKSGTNWERGDSSGQERGWGQLRQDKTQNSRDPNPKTDSYSYSNDDEERERRNYEKEQAQKEFDALLEAERRGDGSTSSRPGWRR
ncbi:hypothetical protein F5Y08DRAFT_241684 [Xylaria arbuscula]|nr:hypothetical protein F5Y08DRAFT_241684 [Xylaria arbuscula]